MTPGTYVTIGLAIAFVAGTWIVSSLSRWHKAREAARLALRADRLAVVVAEEMAHPGDDVRGLVLCADDPTPDELMAVAEHVDVDPKPSYREQVCRQQWERHPVADNTHKVPHLCVAQGPHSYHRCVCGAGRRDEVSA